MSIFVGDKETDSLVMFSILEGIEFYCGTERRKMLKVKKGDGSMLWGNTWKGFLKRDKETNEKIFRPKDPSVAPLCRILYKFSYTLWIRKKCSLTFL